MSEVQFNYQEELKKCKRVDDLLGKDGLIQKLLKDAIESMLEAEIEEHMGRSKYERIQESSATNYRNGYSKKNVRTSTGDVSIDVPRDRNGEFEPLAVRKYEKSTSELENKVIAMYGKGMSVKDIQDTLYEMYGIDVSPMMISRITDKVMETAFEWQSRMLNKMYPIVFLDAIHYKVKEESKIITKAAYICLGITCDGYKDILGIWIGENEGAKFWLSVCNDLRNRGVEDILIACIDGLKGFPDAIKAVFPQVTIQKCIVHQIRNSLKYVASKDQKEFVKDLKLVYKASNEEIALQELDKLKDKWGKKYSVVADSWYNNWDDLSTYFQYPPEIRKVIYTTNALEGFNRQLRKVTKSKSSFPTEDALRKSLYLATADIIKKWSMPIANWGTSRAQFKIIFGDRFDRA